MNIAAETRDDDCNSGRGMGGQAQAFRVEKYQRYHTQWNDNDGSNGSIYVSREGAANKEAARPAYRTQHCGSGDDVLTGISDAVLQQWTAAAATAGSRHGEGQKVGVSTKRKGNKKDKLKTKLTPLHIDAREILHVCYARSLCLCPIDILCTQVS